MDFGFALDHSLQEQGRSFFVYNVSMTRVGGWGGCQFLSLLTLSSDLLSFISLSFPFPVFELLFINDAGIYHNTPWGDYIVKDAK